MNFPISYRVAELVREHISTPYVRASDADVSRALGVSRSAVREYKAGKARMSPDTAARALELLGAAGHEISPLLEELRQQHDPNEAQSAIWRLLLSAAETTKGKAAAWIFAATVAAGMSFAPAGNQASAASFDSSAVCIMRLMDGYLGSLWRPSESFNVSPAAPLVSTSSPSRTAC